MGHSIILASASPRRQQLLQSAGLTLEIRPSHVDESWPEGCSPLEGVVQLAIRKLEAIGPCDRIAVAADTLVVLGEDSAFELLGKPEDAADASRMLRKLSGASHRVITGFCVGNGKHRQAGAVTTSVTFRHLSQNEIDAYVASGEPFDKAGSYAIQGLGGALIASINGSYTNIVGLPVAEVLAAIELVATER